MDPNDKAAQLQELEARKQHTLMQLREAEKAIKPWANLSYQAGPEPTPPISRESQRGLQLAPEGAPHGFGRQLGEGYKAWESLITPTYKAAEPKPYKSQQEAKPKGIPVPQRDQPAGPPIQQPLGAPGTGQGPQTSVGAGQADIVAMIAMLDEAMPFLSDKQLAELLEQNMRGA